MKHTPTPWFVAHYDDQVNFAIDSNAACCESICIEVSEANAKRIVECVNALEGIHDPHQWVAMAKTHIEASELQANHNQLLKEELDAALAEIARMKQHERNKLMEHPSYSSSENKTGIHRY